MENIVLYSRVSTSDQNFESQVDSLRSWAKANEFNVVKSFGETVSGYDPDVEKEQYEAMKAYVLDNNIKHIAIWELSRLSRTMVNTRNELDFFTSKGVNIHFKKEGMQSISSNTANKLLLTIIAAMAEMERDTFIERTSRGRISAVKRGRMIGYSCPPYGYTNDENGIIKIDEDEAKVIKMIFDFYIRDKTLYEIAQELNILKIPTRWTKQGRQSIRKNGSITDVIWRPKVIAQMLHRTLYKGVRLFKGVNYNVPAIVSESDWNKVQDRFKSNTGYLNRTKYDYLFKGKIKCGYCGKNWGTYTLKNRKENQGFYFCCGLNEFGNKCPNGNYIRTSIIDKYAFISLFQHPMVNQVVLDDKRKESKNIELKSHIEFYKIEIEKAEAKKKRVVSAFIDGDLSAGDRRKKLVELDNIIKGLNNKVILNERELTYDEDININELLTSIYKSDEFKFKRDFIVKYVDKVIFNYLKGTNLKFENKLQVKDKILYVRIYAFNDNEPVHLVITSQTKQVTIFSVKDMLTFNEKKAYLTVNY